MGGNPMICTNQHLALQRTQARAIDPVSGIEFVRLMLTVYNENGKVCLQLPCIERGGNYVQLPKGPWVAKMDYYRPLSDPDKKIEALRINFKGPRGNSILIHPANYPGQLEGCIAPGLLETERGVGQSVAALSQVFDALGGFQVGREFELLVA